MQVFIVVAGTRVDCRLFKMINKTKLYLLKVDKFG